MMLEAVHGDAGLAALTRWTNAYDAHYLTLDDVVLAFRPGRSAPDVIDVLASLIERNRMAAHDGDDGDEAESRGTGKPVKPKPEEGRPGHRRRRTAVAGGVTSPPAPRSSSRSVRATANPTVQRSRSRRSPATGRQRPGRST